MYRRSAPHIGIANGMVMVGDGMALDCTVIAEAPNMATRLQGLAKRNGIFECALKGINGLT